jgi:hypothetical protein
MNHDIFNNLSTNVDNSLMRRVKLLIENLAIPVHIFVLNIDGTLILVLNWYVFLEKILQVNG